MNIKIKPNDYVHKEPELREEVVQGLVDYLYAGRGIRYIGKFKDRYLHYSNETGKPWLASDRPLGSSEKIIGFNRSELKKAVELLLKNGYHLKKKSYNGNVDITIRKWPGSNEEWREIKEMPKESWEE